MDITLKASKVMKLLIFLAAALIFMHIVLKGMQLFTDIPIKSQLVRMFNLDAEASLPTAFSAMLLLFSAFLFFAAR